MIFGVNDGVLAMKDRMTTSDGLVYPVDHNLIHLMGNSTSQPMLSLHLYGRDEAAESITGNARVFDLCENKIQRTDGGVFYCLPESEVHRREGCPLADRETELLHHRLMLSRIERISRRTPELERRACELEEKMGAVRLAA